MDRFEIDEKDIEIMKAMLFATCKSKYELKKATKIPYATLQRKIKKLAEYEMITRLPEKPIKKDGTPDKRLPETWDVTIKGLTYLILNNHLKNADLEKALIRLFNSNKKLHGLQPFINIPEYRSIVIQSVTESMSKLRSKINFQHFDREYVITLFLSLNEEILWKHFQKLKTPTLEEAKKLVKKVVKISGKNKLLNWYKLQLQDAQQLKREAENKISIYKTILKFIRNVR
jgi:hypothetical protein